MPAGEDTTRSASNRRLDVAMIGFGRRANEHLDSLLAFNMPIEVKVICDPDPEAQELARQRRPFARVGSDLPALLAQSPCSLAVICLPPSASRKFIGQVLHPGLRAILIEKPAAIDSDAARSAFEGISVPVFIFHQLRVLPWTGGASDWVSTTRKSNHPCHVEAACYGKLLDQGVHLLDLVSLFFGSLPESIDQVVVENDPARISARKPLPADWRIDHAHPGPLAIEVEASWENGDTFRLQCGPAAADGWLGKHLSLSAGDRSLQLGTQGLLSKIGDRVETEVPGKIDDYLRATAEVYRQFHKWIVEAGDEPGVPLISDHIEQLDWCEKVSKGPGQERFEIPFWMESARPPLPILIVIPLSDHRGIGELCVRSWTEQQTALPDDFQLVVISNQETRELGSSLRPYLRPQDTLIETNLPTAAMGQGDMGEYVEGIESSSSEWIFLTEPHCEAPPDAVTELRQFFEQSEAAGFCTDCVDKIESPWGGMEAFYSEEGFEQWKQEGNWSKMIMRGFGIRRTAYEAAGGFRLRYGRFCEWLLAADLHRRGLYLAFAPSVRVIHHYTPNKKYLDEAIEEFVIGQAKYLVDTPEEERLPYFAAPSTELPLSEDLSRLFRDLEGHALRLGIAPRGKFKLSPASRLFLQREWNALIVRLFARWAPRAAYPFFKRYYEVQNSRCLLLHYSRFSSQCEPRSLKKGVRCSAAEEGFTAATEMNQLETWSGIQFRWSKPLFAIRVDIDPGENLSLNLHVVSGIVELDCCRIVALPGWSDGSPVSPRLSDAPSDGDSILVFDLRRRQSPWSGWIAIACQKVDASPEEGRRLGLPIRAISLQAR